MTLRRDRRWRRSSRLRVLFALAALLGSLAASGAVRPPGAGASRSGESSTVWLCRPGAAGDPCTASLTTTVVTARGGRSTTSAEPANKPAFDCFYVYPTVSRELQANSDLRVQRAEVAAAVAQASRFSTVCRVWAPIYRQVTLAGLAAAPGLAVGTSETATAYDSLASAFSDYLSHDNDGRPIVFIGHSQGAAMLILLLKAMFDDDPSRRSRLALAIIAGGNVAVASGKTTGGSFSHIPVCTTKGETGCVIAYSSFPAEPPPGALFGRPGEGVSLQSGQTEKKGLAVACVNPAAIGGGSGLLAPYFPSGGALSTPWVAYPGLYAARCETGGGASWLEVAKATGSSDSRPLVSESAGPLWGYHEVDINLALGNLVSDVAAAEAAWTKAHSK